MIAQPEGFRRELTNLLHKYGFVVCWSETREKDPFNWHLDAKKEGYEVHVEEVPCAS
jgi:hypothetical protein